MGKPVGRGAELVDKGPSLVEAGLGSSFRLGPGRQGGLDGGGYGGKGGHCVM